MSLPLYWPQTQPTHRLVFIPPDSPVLHDARPASDLYGPPPFAYHPYQPTMSLPMPSSPLPPPPSIMPPTPARTYGHTSRATIHRAHAPPPLTISATSSQFPFLTTPSTDSIVHRPPQWPTSADPPSLRSLLPRNLEDIPVYPPHEPPVEYYNGRPKIVHPPPIVFPSHSSVPPSLPPPPPHVMPPFFARRDRRKPTLQRIAELNYPLSAPLPDTRSSMATVQYLSMPDVSRFANDPFGTPPAPPTSVDLSPTVSHYWYTANPILVREPLGLSLSPVAVERVFTDVPLHSPRPRSARSASPTGIRDPLHRPKFRSHSAPPGGAPSSTAVFAVNLSSFPRLRRCSHDHGTHDYLYSSYELIMRQQPIHARMCGVGDKSDRRPIDPTPIIQLNVIDNVDAEADGRKGPRRPESAGGMSHLQNPYYFLFACLVGPEDDEELHIMDDGKSRYLTGTPVSSLYHVKDENRAEVAFFVFPDLGVRKEGRYKLKLTLFEIVDQEVFYCATTFTEGFTVYSAKKFPGMRKATKLSQVVADQGLRIRVRKDPRKRSSNANARSKRYSDSREPSEELYLHQPKRPRYSADPYLQTAPQEARWARDAGQVMYGQPSQHARMAPPPPPHAVSSHSARQALVTPDGRYQNEAHQLSAYPNQPLRSSGDKSSRGFEQPRQIESRSSQRPTSARPPQSPLSAVHPSMQSGPEVYGMYTSSGRLSSRAAPPPELHISQSQHGRESHRERPRSSLSHQQQPLSAQTTSYAQSYNQHAPPTATSQYSESYGSRHHDIGPPPFSAASTASQPQSMLLPPSTSRSRPQSPLRYDHTVRDHSSRQYGSRGMEELSPQMASTSISRHRHHDETKHDYDHSRREMAPRERYALTKPLASNHGMSLEHGARARDQYGSVSVAGDTDYPPYGTKVDDWRCQQQLHQQAHGGHDIGRHSTSASMSSSGHRRMESNDTTRSSGGGMPSLTLPPLGAVAGHTAMGHGLGHGHAASISRSMTSARPYTPSLGRDSGEGSPATTPGGSKASGNRMGLGHLMD